MWPQVSCFCPILYPCLIADLWPLEVRFCRTGAFICSSEQRWLVCQTTTVQCAPFLYPATKPGPKARGPLAIRDIPVDDKELQKCAAGRKNQGSR